MKVLKVLLITIVLIISAIYLEFSGYLYHNNILSLRYSVHGIDISHHQYSINWKLVDKKYKFVLMKATEGKDFSDRDFLYNWYNAQLSGFKVGAYHFFSMLSTGEEQARFYISRVPRVYDSFPPIIDLEIPIKYDKKIVLKELKDMITILESYYKKRVIIYATKHTYKAYIKGEFPDNPLWIRNIKFYPEEKWDIWQYSNRGRVGGISGYTDRNALNYISVDEFIEKYRVK